MGRWFMVCIGIWFLSSCAKGRLESALEFAGENRKELEKVLDYYKDEPLKYKAACFLIENMPSYYAYTCDKYEKMKEEILPLAYERGCGPWQAFQYLEEKYGKLNKREFKKIYDSHVITFYFLIQNIDYAFKVWEESSWGKNFSFQQFCEEILPYRVGNERLESWREHYYIHFHPVLNSGVKTSLEACQWVYDELMKSPWAFEPALALPSHGGNSLLQHRYGDCLARCEMMVYAMRAVGIPCGIDFMIQSPEKKNPHHYWNYMKDERNRSIEFALVDMYPDSVRKESHFKKGKVYRRCFTVQTDSLLRSVDPRDIPASLGEKWVRDVSAEYFPEEGFVLPVTRNEGIAYLNVFNNKEWIPVGYGKIENGKAIIRNLEPGNAYLLSTYKAGVNHPLSLPFVYRGNGKVDVFRPDTTRLQTLVISRKYPMSEHLELFRQRLLNGEFQGANNAEFRNPTVLYRIKELPELRYYKIDLDLDKKFRYLRYISGENGYCDMGEIGFIAAEDQQPVKGRVMGTMSFGNDSRILKEAVFDGDPLTFFSANDATGGWVGLELDHPVKLSKIHFIGRNDDNSIRIGDEYELFYYSEQGWVSLGKRVGSDVPLEYRNVPVGGLYWLRDLTRGQEERIFTWEDGQQVWW